MAARKAKAALPADQVKLDPTAPTPTPAEAVVRAKASRPTFRRAGLVFNDRDWTVIDPEIGEEVARAILAEPVLTVQVRTPDGWRTMTTEERVETTGQAAAAADETGKV